jgi:hypothetical protein
MSIRTREPVCQFCKRPLKDIASRYRLVGSDCWAQLSAAEQAEALERAKAQRDPFHIPAETAPSVRALLNNINARRAAAGEDQLCHHENVAGKCPDCRWEADPDNASVRILREVLASPLEARRAERIAVQTARRARGIPAPASRPAPRPSLRRPAARRSAPAAPTQMAEQLQIL